MSNRTYSIERAECNEECFREALEMVAKGHGQSALAPLNADKMARTVYDVLADSLMIFARDPAGRAIGMLALWEEPYYYSDETYLNNPGLWIEPEWRKTGVLRGLLKEAKAEATKRGIIALITITNPDKQKPADPDAQIVGYAPIGYIMKLQGKRHG